MDTKFWLKRWQDADTGFHRDTPQDLLVKHWGQLGLSSGRKVFVPLCGRSSDMVWLAEQGHTVIGSELSPIAVDQFFEGLAQKPTTDDHSSLTKKSWGPYQLWQGDLFDLTEQNVGAVDVIYDRAALVAIHPNQQPRYARHLDHLLKADGRIFLISLDYNPAEMQGPPFSTPPEQVSSLFGDAFNIDVITNNTEALADSENLKKRGLSALTETLLILTRKTEG